MHRAIGARAIKDPRGIPEILEFRETRVPIHDTHSCMPVRELGTASPERKRKREREREAEAEGEGERGRHAEENERVGGTWVL